MSKHDCETEEGTEMTDSGDFEERTLRVHSGGLETFATPEENIRLTVRLVPQAVDEDGPATVDLQIRSELLGGRFLMHPDRAEELGEQFLEAATAARAIDGAE